MIRKITTFLLMIGILVSAGYSQPVPQKETPKYDLSSKPVLYTVGYAHLDTEWRWDYPETINLYIKATLEDNFRYFEKYKGYVFTFSGARRYKMMKEYYPDQYEKLKKYIGQGRWYVGGSSVDECDANIPSAESLIRQVLYGNRYFKSEFGKESVDFLLPDCFGFQAHLPSVLAYCGLKGFSTQKLVWGSAVGIPFNIGNWNGPDGKGIVAALNATDYGGDIEVRLDTVKYWVDRVMDNGKKYGVYADYRYYGTGDIGGAPSETAIKNGIGSLNNPDSRIQVYLSSSDQLFRDLNDDQKAKLPVYSGDLLLTQHSAGSLTSQAYMKRWNRKNELLAQAAEPLAAAADWLGGESYPYSALNQAWWLILGSQMHDILPGTCIPKAYEYAWNDEVLAQNRFSACLEDGAGVVIRAMDTRTEGIALIVYNPVATEREAIAEAEISYPEGAPENISVFDPTGKEVPAQVLSKTKTSVKFIFPARVASFGLTCYDVRPAKEEAEFNTGLVTGNNTLENTYYKVLLNASGDVISIYDKSLKRELLSAAARLAFQKEHPDYWPAWNMDWKDRKNPPVGYVDEQPKITLVENGPVRIAFRVDRKGRNSVFTQYIRLAAGDQGKRVEFANQVQWQSKGVCLKASFPLTASNANATYNLGLGTTERSTNNEKKYEVPSKEWFDLTDKTGNFGVTVLEDSKYGSDKPDDKTLRLTLLYTPITNFYHDQATQDWGTHEFTYALYSHKGDWRAGRSEWQGRYLNQPLITFRTSNHSGFLGKNFSILKVNTPQADIRAVKKAEDGKGILIRVQELFGQTADKVEIAFPVKVLSATEVDGQEKELGPGTITDGKLVTGLGKYQLRSFIVKLEEPAEKMSLPMSYPQKLQFDESVVSSDQDRGVNAVVPGGFSYPAELFPEKLNVDGVDFVMGTTGDTINNVLACAGQRITLPKTGFFNRVYFLAAAETDTTAIFRIGENKKTVSIQAYTGKIGQFETRNWDKLGRIKSIDPGFIRRDRVAWFATHMHQDSLNMPYQYGYIFLYGMDVSPASGYIELPQNNAVKIFAVTLADNPGDRITPLKPLYDDFTGRKSFPLVLQKRYVTEEMQPLAKLTATRKRNLADLPYRISMKDYADIHLPNGVQLKYFYSGNEAIKGKMPEQGAVISAMNDGMFDLLPSDSVKDIWFESGEGRVVMDLQRTIGIDSLHMFSQVEPSHGPQFFSVWGSDSERMPPVTGDPKAAGWKYVVSATPLDIWGSGKVAYSIVPDMGMQYRWIMWVTEDSSHGPYYFREVDVFER